MAQFAGLADEDNWEYVYAECRDQHVWAYVGPEREPWKLAQNVVVPSPFLPDGEANPEFVGAVESL